MANLQIDIYIIAFSCGFYGDLGVVFFEKDGYEICDMVMKKYNRTFSTKCGAAIDLSIIL